MIYLNTGDQVAEEGQGQCVRNTFNSVLTFCIFLYFKMCLQVLTISSIQDHFSVLI